MAKQKIQPKSGKNIATKPNSSIASKFLKSSANTSGIEIPFGKRNYQLMIVGFAVILIGYALMWGTEDIYDFRKRTLSVLVIMAGFTLEVFAIMHRVKPKTSIETDSKNIKEDNNNQ